MDWVQDGAAADLALASSVYDLMLLDLGLPKKDGSQILGQLRARGNPIPVLILTARDAVSERVKALEKQVETLPAMTSKLVEVATKVDGLTDDVSEIKTDMKEALHEIRTFAASSRSRRPG